ncbi:hypothetical protein HDF26_001283 [Pedobacter cryoconitis]|uniref:DUF3347 domain-containing protein n=1 Tax=Pedobacter cryoconitis TaxID=188932 RepID=A0A7W8ZSA6_9SPHI|nr:DUF3347 domain-containing protein [Pedobacter cryoconitis]MBB5639050.1 hypothetical protein [Pedobacter cryoconitis]MBB6270856.1 hypothetical protein [Pedobacter cryoconitis]
MKKYIGIAVLSTLMACTGSVKKETAVTDTTAAAGQAAEVNDVKLADPKTENIYKSYISLKNSLVAGNAAAAHQTASDLAVSLKAFEGCENTALIAEKIAGTEDLKVQRKEFTALSSDVIALFKHADIKQGVIYVQHCPMANNGDGGDWLSSEKKISNPYYGKEMLTCGAVLEVINAKK